MSEASEVNPVERLVSRPFFHEITDEEWKEMQDSGMIWQEVIDKYSAPDWCGVGGEAVDPMGCWSLVSTRAIRCKDDCKGCPEYKGG